MVLRQKRGMCAHVCEGDEDMITQKYKPQNEILGFSASKRSNKILTFSSGHNSLLSYLSLGIYLALSACPFPFIDIPQVPHPLSSTCSPLAAEICCYTPWSRYSRLTILVHPSQNKCDVSRLCFNKGWLCAMSSSTFSKVVIESLWYYPSLLHLLFFLTLNISAIFLSLWRHPLHSVSIYTLDCCQSSKAEWSWLKNMRQSP